ncbi:MAG TPA: uroporphyrinogen decarboxylase family protein [bacterium]|nr:uroporphyrinogen decarboxylase family protein [bacterium]
MTSKERMMRALHREKPDRLPVTIHQWQQFHLDHYMGGVDPLTAFQMTGMDAAIQYFEAMGQFWIPNAEQYIVQTPQWREEIEVIDPNPNNKILHHTITTPEGVLTYKTGGNLKTTWITEYLVKRHEDIELIRKYMPVAKLDRAKIAAAYDEVGDAGILRGFVWGDQAGCWQHACCLIETDRLILETEDHPDWVHAFLKILLEKKLQFIEESLKGAKFDLIETGGGASSDTLISPRLHREFCLPYDREIHRAVHNTGHICTYHTCGGMMHILDLILENETDVSETLSPPGMGGNITDLRKVVDVYGGRVAMIGGMDQLNVLTHGTPAQIRAEVLRLFEGFGRDGGYILSASDHFFETPPENLRIYADAARECVY